MSYSIGRPERIWKLTYDGKMTAAQVAHYLGVSREYVYVALKRHRDKLGLPPLGMPRVAKPEAPKRGRPAEDEQETPRQSRRRIEHEVAAGKRCTRCHLLLPCGGHDYQVRRNYHDPREAGA